MAVHQQLRIVRLAMLLVIGALTIFIYASYYTSPMLTPSTRISISASSSSAAASSDYETNSNLEAVRVAADRRMIEVANSELSRFEEGVAASSDGQKPQPSLDELPPSSAVVASDSGQ